MVDLLMVLIHHLDLGHLMEDEQVPMDHVSMNHPDLGIWVGKLVAMVEILLAIPPVFKGSFT